MRESSNGLRPVENLNNQRKQPVFAENADPVLSKCISHPTKRMFTSDIEAIREAEVRSVAAKMPIAAYRCDSCGNAHLCKRANAHPGSVLEREERKMPPVPGNTEARRRFIRQHLEGRTSITSEEVMEVLGVKRGAMGRYMNEVGWHNTRGRAAKWIPNAAPAPAEVAPLVQPIDLAKRRHPSTQNVGWRPITALDRIRHMPVGDLMDTLEAVGLELRLMTREKES